VGCIIGARRSGAPAFECIGGKIADVLSQSIYAGRNLKRLLLLSENRHGDRSNQNYEERSALE
jgi:hypothetical protein